MFLQVLGEEGRLSDREVPRPTMTALDHVEEGGEPLKAERAKQREVGW